MYVDSNTQMLNTQALAAGSTLRFYGLVFNDNGTLRMDCAQVTMAWPSRRRLQRRNKVTRIQVRSGKHASRCKVRITRQP